MATKKPFRDRSPLKEALHRFVCDAHLKSEFLSEFWMFPERYDYLKHPASYFIFYFSPSEEKKGSVENKPYTRSFFLYSHKEDIDFYLRNYPDAVIVFCGKDFNSTWPWIGTDGKKYIITIERKMALISSMSIKEYVEPVPFL